MSAASQPRTPIARGDRSHEFSAFISYASEDGEKAHEVCAHLERGGATCWIAPRNVRAGREYADEIVTGIERSACTIVLLSRAANTSAFVCREVERAVANHKPVLPVRLEPVMPDAGLELFISGIHWLDAFEGDWDTHMRRLARDVVDLTAEASGRRTRKDRDRQWFRPVYAAAALVVLAMGGVGVWTFFPGRGQTPASETRLPPTAETASEASAPPARQPQPADGAVPPSSPAANARPDTAAGAGSAAAPTETRAPGQLPSRDTASTRPAPGTSASPDQANTTLRANTELTALRDAFDDLSIRAETLDDTLNRLWEEMRPLAPRVDIATRQRSLKASLTRAREAIGARDAAAAGKYLDTARADAAALEEFLGR